MVPWLNFHCLGIFHFRKSQATNRTMSLRFFKHFLFVCVCFISWWSHIPPSYWNKAQLSAQRTKQEEITKAKVHLRGHWCGHFSHGTSNHPSERPGDAQGLILLGPHQTITINSPQTSRMAAQCCSAGKASWPFTPVLHPINHLESEMCCWDNERWRIYSRCCLERLWTMQNYLCSFTSINLLL